MTIHNAIQQEASRSGSRSESASELLKQDGAATLSQGLSIQLNAGGPELHSTTAYAS